MSFLLECPGGHRTPMDQAGEVTRRSRAGYAAEVRWACGECDYTETLTAGCSTCGTRGGHESWCPGATLDEGVGGAS